MTGENKSDNIKLEELPPNESLKNVVATLKENSSHHKTNVKSISRKYEADTRRRSGSYRR